MSGPDPSIVKPVREAVDFGKNLDGWSTLWEKGLTPWDYGEPHYYLTELLKKDKLKQGRYLVPGCGSGHAPEALAKAGRTVVGLDISELAARKVQEKIDEVVGEEGKGKSYAVAANFFEFEDAEKFDSIYDETFFCVLNPMYHKKWANKMRQLLKEDGELITMIYPIGDWEAGPPFAVSPDLYKKVLEPAGFVIQELHEIPPPPLEKQDVPHFKMFKQQYFGRWKVRLDK